jgi:hypothetical protein
VERKTKLQAQHSLPWPAGVEGHKGVLKVGIAEGSDLANNKAPENGLKTASNSTERPYPGHQLGVVFPDAM